MLSAFLKVLCPQKGFDQGQLFLQRFSLGNKQCFYLLISDLSLLSVDLKSPADNTDP